MDPPGCSSDWVGWPVCQFHDYNMVSVPAFLVTGFALFLGFDSYIGLLPSYYCAKDGRSLSATCIQLIVLCTALCSPFKSIFLHRLILLRHLPEPDPSRVFLGIVMLPGNHKSLWLLVCSWILKAKLLLSTRFAPISWMSRLHPPSQRLFVHPIPAHGVDGSYHKKHTEDSGFRTHLIRSRYLLRSP